MGRDTRGDRYARRPDGASSNVSDGRYGRYAASRRSHRRTTDSTRDGKSGKRRRSRSVSDVSSSASSRRGGRRFETVDVQQLLREGDPTPPTLSSDDIFHLIQQQQQQQMGMGMGMASYDGHGVYGGSGVFPMDSIGAMADAAQQQLQQQPLFHPHEAPPPFEPTQEMENANQGEKDDTVEEEEKEEVHVEEKLMDSQVDQHETPNPTEEVKQPPPPQRVLPSVEDFVPVIPKSLLSLLSAPAKGNGSTENAETPLLPSAEATSSAVSLIPPNAGALTVLQAPKLSPEAERRARESRRAHVSGFPPRTTQQELLQYFLTVIPMVRRVRVRREMDAMAAESGEESESREIPLHAVIDVDRVMDLTLNSAKSKPFAFLEVNLADLITEMVEASTRDPNHFTFMASDGQSYPIAIRRPRDYQTLQGVDKRKVVMMGFPATLSAEKLRGVFEQYGALLSFDVKAGMAYAEFATESEAMECVRDLHGLTLGSHVVILTPLHDWLKVVCTHAGIDITLEDDDPVSGVSLLAKDAQSAGALVPVLAEDVGKQNDTVDHMKELLEMGVLLPDVVLHFVKTFAHLTTLYGSTVPIFPTRVLVLLNLFDEEELVLDETYEHLLEEISSEVEKYGRVRELLVPRRSPAPMPPKPPRRLFTARMKPTKKPNTQRGAETTGKADTSTGITDALNTWESVHPNNHNPPHPQQRHEHPIPSSATEAEEEEEEAAEYEAAKAAYFKAREAYMERLMHPIHGGFGRVFVEYASVDEAAAAQQAIAGRLFGGRTVVTSFMFEDVLHPPSAEEEAAGAEEKVALYLESVGAGEEKKGNGEEVEREENNAKEESLGELD